MNNDRLYHFNAHRTWKKVRAMSPGADPGTLLMHFRIVMEEQGITQDTPGGR